MTEIIQTETPVDRLLRLLREGSGYVFLPGGTGTLLEIAAAWEFMNKGVLPPRPAIVIGDFWRVVIDTVRKGLESEGRAGSADLFVRAQSPEECVKMLSTLLKETS